jgi:hypothetical protein
MGLTTPSNDYTRYSTAWKKTRDVAEGSLCVKNAAEVYLPKGTMTDNAYLDYLNRAVFVGYVDKIIDFAVGQLNRNPVQAPDIPEDIAKDVDLCGNSLQKFAEHTARELMLVERMGIWYDYSETKERPYMVAVHAENIIKWNYGYNQNGEKILMSVVLKVDEESIDPASFDVIKEKRWIVLRLDENGFFVKDTYKEGDKEGDVALIESISPTAGINGDPLSFIPFDIVCVKGHPERIHPSPMYPVAEVNLSLYRSMASREQLLFYYGMPTGIAVGWDQSKAFPIGGIAAFPTGGSFQFAQVQVAAAVDQAITSKKEEIAQIGSSFLSGRGRYVASATTAEVNQEGDNASLASLANTISNALTKAFLTMRVWDDEIPETVSVSVNTEFEEPELTQGELTELGQEVAAGRMSFDTYFYNLKKNKVYPNEWSIEQEKAALDETSKMVAQNKSQIPGITF